MIDGVCVCACVFVFAGCAEIQGNSILLKFYCIYYRISRILPHYPWTTCGEFWLLCFSGAHGRFRSGGAKEKFHAAKQSLSVESFCHPFRGTSISYAGRHGYGKRHVKAPRDEAVDSLKCCNVQSLSNGNARHIESC